MNWDSGIQIDGLAISLWFEVGLPLHASAPKDDITLRES